jgi:hypothetical protein
MLISGVLCLCAAVSTAGFGAWSLSRTHAGDATRVALRAMGPAQLAAAIMLAAGGAVALAASSHTALVLVIISIVGALGTLAAGSWQVARYTLSRPAVPADGAGCPGNCGSCALSCS